MIVEPPCAERCRAAPVFRGSTVQNVQKLEETLTRHLRGHGIPGAQAGLLMSNRRIVAGAGILDRTTGREVLPTHRFSIGSITKLLTAHLIMGLIEEGRLQLDTRVCDLIPDFRLSDSRATDALTIFHLLTHTGGFFGDFEPSPNSSESLAGFVAACAAAPQLTPPGEVFSYSNAGFSILGRIIELLHGRTWHTCVSELLLLPLSMKSVSTDGATVDPSLRPTGYRREGGELQAVEFTKAPEYGAPAGAGVTASIDDLLRFSQFLLGDGLTDDGRRLMSGETIGKMWTRHVEATPHTDGWGLGWRRYAWLGGEVIGHDGATPGECAFLRIMPRQRVALTVTCNAEDANEFFNDVARDVLGPIGISPPPFPKAVAGVGFPFDDYAGRYRQSDVEIVVERDGGGLSGAVYAAGTSETIARFDLLPVAECRFLARPQGGGGDRVAAFFGGDRRRPRYLTTGIRTFVRDDA